MIKSGEILKTYRKNKGLTVSKFAEMLGVSQVFLTNLEHDKKKISEKLFGKLKDFLSADEIKQLEISEKYKDVPEEIKKKIEKLENENKILKEKSNAKILNEELIDISVIAKASAGNGYLNFEKAIKSVTLRKNGFDENCYLIEVEGNSMEPLIQDGSFIVVDPRETEIIDNKIYVIEFEEQIYIKKVLRNEQLKVVILKSINREYEDIYITEERINEFKIRGRAVKFILEGKL